MAQEPNYGFVIETFKEPPGHSLRKGGPSGDKILAEQVAAELVRIEQDIANVQAGIPRLLDYVLGTADQGNIQDSDVAISGLELTVDIPPGQVATIIARGHATCSSPPGNVRMSIQRNGTNIDGDEKQCFSSTDGQPVGLSVLTIDAPGGTVTYRVAMRRISAGGGTVTFRAGADHKSLLAVYLSGPDPHA